MRQRPGPRKSDARTPRCPCSGIPFAVKDNIDVDGMPTTAACKEFARRPARSATVVDQLFQAGAILVGKTNLDQFATGLVGVRSPYGPVASPFDPRYISGGSSSGSAVAVSTGMVSFALGTDTAGSGRVPAAFNNIVGLKPTRGVLSCSACSGVPDARLRLHPARSAACPAIAPNGRDSIGLTVFPSRATARPLGRPRPSDSVFPARTSSSSAIGFPGCSPERSRCWNR